MGLFDGWGGNDSGFSGDTSTGFDSGSSSNSTTGGLGFGGSNFGLGGGTTNSSSLDSGSFGSNSGFDGGYGLGGDSGFSGFGKYDPADYGSIGFSPDFDYNQNSQFGNNYSQFNLGNLANLDYSNPFNSGMTTSPVDGFLGLSNKPTGLGLRNYTVKDDITGQQVEAAPVDTKFKSMYDVTYDPVQSDYNNRVVQNRYDDNPLTKVANALGLVGQYGSLVNPAAAPAGLVGGLMNMGLRGYYGLPNDYSGLAGSVANNVVGGGMGGMLAGSLANAGVRDYQNTGDFGDTLGKNVIGGISSGVLGQFGPYGQLANMGIQNLMKMGLGAYNQYATNKAVKEAGSDTDVAGRMNSLYANKANNSVYRNDLDNSRNEMIAALAAQGKLGSGSRVVAAGKLAGQNADKQFQNYATNMQNAYNQNAQYALQNMQAKLAKQNQLSNLLMDTGNAIWG